ncbi:cysteine desulfurase (plasmid) [Sphingomonas sp. CL5.1]|uniref:cysteine desulfurase family protein n=1 Tax=Sphingomonas sp. CL5.1 TaxID=2653203 RepID=UPI00158317FD|nr:cysteine desulfurase family protein [Sphingomonas sp. CL5.1]QKS02335.1 cysteine desulfurase [Sphingomonas sp. CL5.1]
MQSVPIYLDGFATLPLADEARAAMLAVWEQPGNAGSPNASGERAARIIADARADVASLIGATASEIIFTSGATEANNLALLGVATATRSQSARRRIVVSAIEHKAVLEPAAALAAEGFEVRIAPVDRHGRLDLEAMSGLLDETVLLVSVMLVNNETGVIQPVEEVAALAHRVGAYVHTDAAQAAGKIAIDVAALDVDYLSLSAHKCYGPMGVGALYVAAGMPAPVPLMRGGGQQSGIRPGTEPVPLIAGFGAAARVAIADLARGEIAGPTARIGRLLEGLASRQLRFARITGDHAVVPGSAAIAIDGIDGDSLCAQLARDVSLSTGSACTSGQIRISHVLEAMGFSEETARSVVRIFCDRTVTDADIDRATEAIVASIHRSQLATGEVRQ